MAESTRKFNVGDTVVLNSGSPIFTVAGYLDDGNVDVVSCPGDSPRLRGLPEACLTRVFVTIHPNVYSHEYVLKRQQAKANAGEQAIASAPDVLSESSREALRELGPTVARILKPVLADLKKLLGD